RRSCRRSSRGRSQARVTPSSREEQLPDELRPQHRVEDLERVWRDDGDAQCRGLAPPGRGELAAGPQAVWEDGGADAGDLTAHDLRVRARLEDELLARARLEVDDVLALLDDGDGVAVLVRGGLAGFHLVGADQLAEDA